MSRLEAKDRRNNPNFIQKMNEISRGRPSPMEGKTHKPKTIDRIRQSVQNAWNRRHDIAENADPLTKRRELVTEWIRTTQLLGHTPSSKELDKLKKARQTRFSTTMYKKEFGDGSFTKAREVLSHITSLYNFADTLLRNPSQILTYSVLETDVKAIHKTLMTELQSIIANLSTDNATDRIQALNDKITLIKRELNAKIPHLDHTVGEDERSIWTFAVEQNLLAKIVQDNMLTQQEIDLLEKYFENGIIGEGLGIAVFNRFTIAVANMA